MASFVNANLGSDSDSDDQDFDPTKEAGHVVSEEENSGDDENAESGGTKKSKKKSKKKPKQGGNTSSRAVGFWGSQFSKCCWFDSDFTKFLLLQNKLFIYCLTKISGNCMRNFLFKNL